MGFHDRGISIIMMCIIFVYYSIPYFVLINGEPKGKIIPSQGIRQEDPLSPFMFLLCAEGLSTMLQRGERLGISRGSPYAGGLRGCLIYFL